MSGHYHARGHRVASVCFARREACCDCGAVVTVPDDEIRILRDEALAVAFSRHRSAERGNIGHGNIGRYTRRVWTPA